MSTPPARRFGQRHERRRDVGHVEVVPPLLPCRRRDRLAGQERPDHRRDDPSLVLARPVEVEHVATGGGQPGPGEPVGQPMRGGLGGLVDLAAWAGRVLQARPAEDDPAAAALGGREEHRRAGPERRYVFGQCPPVPTRFGVPGQVDDGLGSDVAEEALGRRRVGQVALDDVAAVPDLVKSRCPALAPDQGPGLVARLREPSHDMGADEPGRARHEHLHQWCRTPQSYGMSLSNGSRRVRARRVVRVGAAVRDDRGLGAHALEAVPDARRDQDQAVVVRPEEDAPSARPGSASPRGRRTGRA